MIYRSLIQGLVLALLLAFICIPPLSCDETEDPWSPTLDLNIGWGNESDLQLDQIQLGNTSEEDLSFNQDDYYFPSFQMEHSPDLFTLDQKFQAAKPKEEAPSLIAAQESGHLPEKEAKSAPKPHSEALDPPPEKLIAQNEQAAPSSENEKPILINFNNVSIVEFIRYISRATGKNFVFDESTLQFNVSIVSEEPTTLSNVLTALMQVLRVHDLSLIEQGNNIIIHNNKLVNQISQVVAEGLPLTQQVKEAELVTRVFRLNTLDAEKASLIITPLVSTGALVEVLKDTSHIIVTDVAANVEQIGRLLKSLDAPNSGYSIGQYVVTNALIDSLIGLAEKVMAPMAEGKSLVFVAHAPSNSIFVVSTPFLVDRSLAILRTLDINIGQTRIFSPESLRFPGTSQVRQPLPGELGYPGYQSDAAAKAAAAAAAAAAARAAALAAGATEAAAAAAGAAAADAANAGASAATAGQDATAAARAAGATEAAANAAGAAAAGAAKGSGGGISTGTPGTFPTGPEGLRPGVLENVSPWSSNLPAGNIERTKFYIHKLHYRKGEQIVDALNRIGASLETTGASNADLISTIQSIQWLEGSNSLVFTGTMSSIAKVKELIEEIDIPLRQVFIEMLILDTTLDDSLSYSVNFGSRFRGNGTSGSQAFLSGSSTLASALDTTLPGSTIDPTSLTRTIGYNLGIIGRSISHCGLNFDTLGALVSALHTKTKVEILMSPKLLVEDNAVAEIFVGINTAFQTQSIANDQGSIITSNFEFRDVGTRMKITPLISNNNVITLDIEEEVSSVATTNATTGSLNTQSPGPTTNLSRTTTRVHVPNKYFLVMSGMVQDQQTRERTQVPCLGGAPLIGALFSDKELNDQKRNIMIFIRPQIIDTDEDVDNITRHQQDVFREANRSKSMWKYEVEEALDLLNLKEPDVSLHDSEVYNP
jgi:type III secretion protein C